MSQRHYLLNTTMPTSDLRALRQGVNADTVMVVEVAECVYAVPLPWFACFRQVDLHPCVVEMDSDSFEIMVPVADVPTAIANLESALPFMEDFTGERAYAREYWQSALDALKTLPLPFLTMDVSEILMNVEAAALTANLTAALGQNPEALAVIKRCFLEYDDKVLPYHLAAFYANEGITDKSRLRNTIALNMAIGNGLAWTKQAQSAQETPSRPPAPPAIDQRNARAGETSADLYRHACECQEAGDFEQAVSWYRRAIEVADASDSKSTDMFVNGSAAACNLADKYEHGLGVPQDYQQALAWYGRSAAKGNRVAQYSLGMMHKNGLGVPADNTEASGWFQQSARQGYADAAKELALMSAAALKARPVEKSGFAAGTLVHTQEGLRPIETLEVGDLVLTWPEDRPIPVRECAPFRLAEEYVFAPVIKTSAHEGQAISHVPLIGMGSDDAALCVTPNHHIWSKNRGWVAASEMKFGHCLVNGNFSNTMAGRARHDVERVTVFNIQVEDSHTYFVGALGLWVHT